MNKPLRKPTRSRRRSLPDLRSAVPVVISPSKGLVRGNVQLVCLGVKIYLDAGYSEGEIRRFFDEIRNAGGGRD